MKYGPQNAKKKIFGEMKEYAKGAKQKALREKYKPKPPDEEPDADDMAGQVPSDKSLSDEHHEMSPDKFAMLEELLRKGKKG